IPAVVLPSSISIAAVPKLLGTLDSNPLLASMPPLPSVVPRATVGGEAEANEFRFLRSKLTEMAQEVWKQRITPKIVKVMNPQRAREEAESKRKEDAENEETKSSSTSATSTSSPFHQYVNERLHAVHIQQCCDQLNQRINQMADQQRLRQWTTV